MFDVSHHNEAKVQIEKKHTRSPLPSSAITSCAAKAAQEYAATFPARLALARWTRGGDIPHSLIPADQLPPQAAWHAQVQRNFQSWLEAGGFHRSEFAEFDSVITNAITGAIDGGLAHPDNAAAK